MADGRADDPAAHDRRLFVSYAREERTFVARLAEELGRLGFEVWVDISGLYVGEEFWDRIRAEIDRATAVVCVVSESFAGSAWCGREAEHAASRGKRILPVVVDAVEARRLPEPIRVRHWLSFAGPDEFERSLSALVAELRRDPEWVREHTRLLVRAVEWDERDRSPSLCLRGRELDEAVAWLARGDGKEPPVHELHVAFVEASRAADEEATERAERQSRVSRSRALTSRAELLRSASGPHLTAALLAAHAFDEHRSPEAYEVLRRTLGYLPPCSPRLEHPYRVGAVCFGPNGRLLATAAGMTLEEELNLEVVRSSRGPGLEHVDEYTPGMRRLRAEQRGRNADAFDAFVWDASTGARLARLPHRGRVRALAFLPDGDRLLTACDSGEAALWSVGDERRLASFPHPGPCWFAAVSPDGARALTIAENRRSQRGRIDARVWSIEDGEERLRLQLGGVDDSGPVLRRELTAFAACGRLERLATAFLDGSIRIRSLDDGSVLASGAADPEAHALAFDAEGGRLAIGEETRARVVDAADLSELVVLPHAGPVVRLCWSPAGDRLVTARGSGSLIPFDVEVWRLDGTREAAFQTGWVRELEVSPDGGLLAVAAARDAALVHDLAEGAAVRAELHFEDSVETVAFGPDGARVAAGGDDGSARVWEARAGLELVRAELDGDWRLVRLSPDAGRVAVAGPSGCRVLDAGTGRRLAHRDADDWIDDLGWSPDGGTVALASRDGLRLWRWGAGDSVGLEHDGLRAFAFGPDGAYVATAGRAEPRRKEPTAGAGKIWRAADGALAGEVRHGDTAVAAAAHPDGVTFATAAGPFYGHGVWIVRAGRGSPVAVEIAEPANALAFSPDGELLAVGYHELGLALFDTRTGRRRAEVDRLREVRTVVFDPGGRFLAVTTLREQYQAPPVPETEVLAYGAGRLDEPDAVLRGETVLRFLDDGSFLATEDGAAVHVRETGSWERVCSFAGPSPRETFSFAGGLLARLEREVGVRMTVSAWRPDDLADELRRRLPRDLSEDEWRGQMGAEPFRPLSSVTRDGGPPRR